MKRNVEEDLRRLTRIQPHDGSPVAKGFIAGLLWGAGLVMMFGLARSVFEWMISGVWAADYLPFVLSLAITPLMLAVAWRLRLWREARQGQ